MRLPAQRQVGRIEVDGNVGPREMVAPQFAEDRIRLIGRLPDTASPIAFPVERVRFPSYVKGNGPV